MGSSKTDVSKLSYADLVKILADNTPPRNAVSDVFSVRVSKMLDNNKPTTTGQRNPNTSSSSEK